MKTSTMSKDRNLKIQLNTSSNTYKNIKLNQTSSTFKPKTEVTPVDKEIYYDDIVYYDGGDVHGYGDS